MWCDGTPVTKRLGRVRDVEQDVLSLNQLHCSTKIPTKDVYFMTQYHTRS